MAQNDTVFRTESPYPMIASEEAWRRIMAHVERLAARTCPISQALGLVLAEDVRASEDMPPFPASAMDGYAVIAAEGSSGRRVIGEQDAGLKKPLRVQAGEAVRIMTGAPLPEGADAVIPVEWTHAQAGMVYVQKPVFSGDYVRPAGQDIRTGEIVLERGGVVGPAEIGLLATLGRREVPVYPRPRVAVMASGDELVPPDITPGPGQIRDSNSYALSAAVEAAGGEPLSLGVVADDAQALRKALLRGVTEADMLITSGGVSMGARDLIKPLLEELGTVHFGRVAIKPGKPLTFATVQGKPVFGLPGFPVSSLVMFEVFVRPALRRMAGHDQLMRPEVRARLRHAIRHDPERTEFQRAMLRREDGVFWAETTGDQVSGRLKSLVGANALLRLEAGQRDFGAGDEIPAILILEPETSVLS